MCAKYSIIYTRISYSAEVKERVELHLYALSAPSWYVIGWTLPILPFYTQISAVHYSVHVLQTKNWCFCGAGLPCPCRRNSKSVDTDRLLVQTADITCAINMTRILIWYKKWPRKGSLKSIHLLVRAYSPPPRFLLENKWRIFKKPVLDVKSVYSTHC